MPGTGHKRILEDFINVIKPGCQPRCDDYQGRRSVNLVEAAVNLSTFNNHD